MEPYTYKDECEREETQKYEGTYSIEEIELNRRLLEECEKKKIDFSKVENLLKQGADPNGGTSVAGYDLLNHILGDIITYSEDTNSVNLPRLTKLFLKYGMDIDNPRVPYDGSNSVNPMWCLTFATNENSTIALKILLDHGLSADSFSEFWGHSMGDFGIYCEDPENDEFYHEAIEWAFKMMLLGASYNHILEQDEELREFICHDYNTSDVHIFRNWNEFEYHFDTSHCDKKPELWGSIVHIYSKITDEEVWTIGVGEDARKVLEEFNNKQRTYRISLYAFAQLENMN